MNNKQFFLGMLVAFMLVAPSMGAAVSVDADIESENAVTHVEDSARKSIESL